MRFSSINIAILLVWGVSAVQIQCASVTQDRLEEVAEAAVRAKEGLAPETLIRVGPLHRSQDPDYYEIEMNVNWGSERLIASIAKNQKTLVVGKIYRLKSLTPQDVGKALHLVWGVAPSDAVVLRETGPSVAPGFSSYEVVIANGSHNRKGWLTITSDKRFLTLGDVYALKAPSEVRNFISTASVPSVGSSHPRVSIVEYSDFECPLCAKMDQLLVDELLPQHPDVRIIFKDFPLQYHAWAETAAVGGRCAYAISPSSYVGFRQLIFRHQAELTPANIRSELLEIGGQVGIDTDSLKSCIDDGKTLSAVRASRDEAEALQVSVTPTFYVNGFAIAGAWTKSDLDALVSRAVPEDVSKFSSRSPN